MPRSGLRSRLTCQPASVQVVPYGLQLRAPLASGLLRGPWKDEEQKLGLTVLPYARTVIVIGVHPTVADDGITSEDLVRIYKKTKTSWQDGHEIVVLTREPGDNTIL